MSDFSLFGIGGLPDMYQFMLERGEGERLAKVVIEGSKDARIPADYLRTVAQILVEWYGQRTEPTPAFVFEANAAALMLISPDTGQGRPAPGVRELLGVPKGVGFGDFLESAGRDAYAWALSVLPEHDDDLGKSIEKIIFRVDDAKRIDDWPIAAHAISDASKRDGRSGFSPNTVKSYREQKSEYRHIVKEVAGHLLIQLVAAGVVAARPLYPEAIKELVVAVPSTEVVARVNGTRSVWSTRPGRIRGDSEPS